MIQLEMLTCNDYTVMIQLEILTCNDYTVVIQLEILTCNDYTVVIQRLKILTVLRNTLVKLLNHYKIYFHLYQMGNIGLKMDITFKSGSNFHPSFVIGTVWMCPKSFSYAFKVTEQ